MIAASQAKDPLVKATDIPILFNHLTDMIELSDRLLICFQQDKSNIGKVFKSVESDLVVFLKYSMHYRTNIKSIKRACSNVLFVKIDQVCMLFIYIYIQIYLIVINIGKFNEKRYK